MIVNNGVRAEAWDGYDSYEEYGDGEESGGARRPIARPAAGRLSSLPALCMPCAGSARSSGETQAGSAGASAAAAANGAPRAPSGGEAASGPSPASLPNGGDVKMEEAGSTAPEPEAAARVQAAEPADAEQVVPLAGQRPGAEPRPRPAGEAAPSAAAGGRQRAEAAAGSGQGERAPLDPEPSISALAGSGSGSQLLDAAAAKAAAGGAAIVPATPEAAALSAADADDVPVGAPVCVFCARGAHPVCGRLIPVSPGCWAHVNCAMWSSEVFEKEAGVLYNMPSAVRRSVKKRCAHCHLPGASVGCFHKKCLAAYHFACARSLGCAYTPDDGRSTWCPLHAPPKAITPLPVRVSRSVAVNRSLRLHRADEGEAQQAAAAESVLLQVGQLKVLRLGRPQPARPQFHERHQIFPLGYTARRRFHDLARLPPATCEYSCKVGEHAGLPSFVIAHPTEPGLCFKSSTATGAWHALVNRRARVHGVRPLNLTPAQMQLEGALFFGLAVPAVAQLIEQLPGAKSCEGFHPRYSRPEAMQKVPPLPKSTNGCARADPYVKRSSQYKAAHSVYHRPFLNRGAIQSHKEKEEPAEGEEREGLLLRRREGESRSVGQLAALQSFSALQKLHYNVRVGRSPIHNWGLFTTCGIPKDAMVVEYKGEAMRNVLADLKEKKYGEGALRGQGGDCYMFRIDPETVLDATVKGNVARFMNHCCHPNCYSKVIEVDDDRGAVTVRRKHIVIFAQRDLEAGEEIMYDYKFGVEKEKIICHCGHPKCLGVMN